jgi:hypothetical protein
MHTYKIDKIVKIIDGDTIDVIINLGFYISIKHRVRLKDIDAAEIRTLDLEEKAQGLAAKVWLEEQLSREGEWIIETYCRTLLRLTRVYLHFCDDEVILPPHYFQDYDISLMFLGLYPIPYSSRPS